MPPSPEPAVLLLSDAPEALEPIVRALGESGFGIDVADGPAALTAYRPQHVLVLVDDRIKAECIDLVRALRARSEVPVIVLLSTGEEHRAVGVLEAGADHVVALPARERELVARARAAIRRGPEPLIDEGAIEVGDVRLDAAGYVVSVAGERVDMTRKEFELLRLLMTNAGQTVPRRVLIERVWGWDSTGGKTLDTHIRRVRAKIESNPSKPVRIVTVRKVGYRFNRPRR